MHATATGGRKRARIEIIPLIDIMFFLLASFMLVSMNLATAKSVKVNLPIAQTGDPENKPNTLAISVDTTGGIFLDKRPPALSAYKIPENVSREVAGHQNEVNGPETKEADPDQEARKQHCERSFDDRERKCDGIAECEQPGHQGNIQEHGIHYSITDFKDDRVVIIYCYPLEQNSCAGYYYS